LAEYNDIFDKLCLIVGAPGSKRFAKVLAAMMSPEEAQLMIELKTPMTTAQLAKKMNTDEKSLQAKLDDMQRRQIIRKMKDAYITPNSVVGFHHGAIGWLDEELKTKVYPLWGDFFFEEWRDIIVDDFEKRHKTGAPGAHRVVPSYKSLVASPAIKPDQILWYEDMRQILKRATRISIMMCGCRGLWRKCDNPVNTCIQLELPTAIPRPPRQDSDFIKPPHDMTYEEAMKLVDDCEDRGLVHLPLNTSQGDMYCNCCDDCCMVINPLLHRGNLHEILTPSRYRAEVNEELCVGCKVCVGRCKFDAIEMQPVPGTKKLKSRIKNENCMGCGACVVSCKKKAMTMALVRPPSHIPTVSVMELFMMAAKKKE
jgi:Na+-translocating ferredoxin:NAD+ oxidoreductase subunit B